ncbi:MAG: glycosyltransferase family 4 protein [Anaerolineales bacterium]|jgi:glycosyltransferase involved in cell wall biosynthesis
MNVIHLLKATGIAGAETHLLALLPALRGQGINCGVILLEDPRREQRDFRERLERSGVPVHSLPIRWHIDPGLPARLEDLLREEPFDILHAHLPHGEVYGEFAMRSFPSGKFVISRHNDDRFRRTLPMRWVFTPSLRRADRIVAISQSIRRFLIDVERAPAEKIEVIPYGLDAEAFAREAHPGAFRREIGAGENPLVGFIGRMTAQKGVDILLRVFARVERRHSTAKLILAGDGPDRQGLMRLAKSLGLQRVVFLGWRTDAADILADIDLLAIPSRWEGFGLVALEAMALGKPIAASKVSALPEIVLQSETGLLLTPGSVEEWADGIIAILSDPKRAVEMGRAGRDRVRKEFPVERMARRTAGVYHMLTDNPHGGKA